jgi:hypothetical protein
MSSPRQVIAESAGKANSFGSRAERRVHGKGPGRALLGAQDFVLIGSIGPVPAL